MLSTEYEEHYQEQELYSQELYYSYNEEYAKYAESHDEYEEHKIPLEVQLQLEDQMQDLKEVQLQLHDIKPDAETVIYNAMSMTPIDHENDNFNYYNSPDGRIPELGKLEKNCNNDADYPKVTEFVSEETLETGPVNVDVVN